MEKRFTDFYMDIAVRTAKMSRARRLQVGSVLVKDDAIISYGWNGTAAGMDNNCEEEVKVESIDEDGVITTEIVLRTKPEVIHAEANCILKVAKSNNSTVGSSLFVTHSPCIECAKLIRQSGINKVYFGAAYRDSHGIDFLKRAGVDVIQIDSELS